MRKLIVALFALSLISSPAFAGKGGGEKGDHGASRGTDSDGDHDHGANKDDAGHKDSGGYYGTDKDSK